MSLPVPINWLRTNSRPVERLPDHIWILHERHSDTLEWDNPAGTWWVQPDYYPDTELGFARAWDKLCSLLQSSMIDVHDVNRAIFYIHLYLTDEAQEKYQFTDPQAQQGDYWFSFNLTLNDDSEVWGAIPSKILGELGVDANTLNEITNEIQVWIRKDRGRYLQGRLDRANLPRTLRQT